MSGSWVPVTYRRYLRLYPPNNAAASSLDGLPLDYKLTCTILYDYLGKRYDLDMKVSREILALVISKAKKFQLATPEAQVAVDVASDYWAAPPINAVLQSHIMSKYSDGTFKTDKWLSRYDLVRFLSLAAGQNEERYAELPVGKGAG